MATRFKKLRTRRMKRRDALKTRKHKGGSLASLFQRKKTPLTTPLLTTAKNDSSVMYGRKDNLSEWVAKKQKKSNVAKKLRTYAKTLKGKSSEVLNQAYSLMNNETRNRTKRLAEYANINALSDEQLLELYYSGKVRSASV
jgi:hypothetical protein